MGLFTRSKKKKAVASRINSAGSNLLGGFARRRKEQLVYAQNIRRPIVGSGIKKQGRGRPRGSYDPRYAQYGGVYGYRKILNAELRARRIEQARRLAVTPRQQYELNQIEARRRVQQDAPENQVIPDTTGNIPTRSIHQEIDDAANIFP